MLLNGTGLARLLPRISDDNAVPLLCHFRTPAILAACSARWKFRVVSGKSAKNGVPLRDHVCEGRDGESGLRCE